MSEKPKLYRRCTCHQMLVSVWVDDGEDKRHCTKTLKVIPIEKTYLSTKDSPEAYVKPPEAVVQRGARMDD